MESVSDLPGSVSTLEDYGRLLSAFHAAHAPIEHALSAPELASGWRELGIDIESHLQLDALTEDLTALGQRPRRRRSSRVRLEGPSQALGHLYVIEGSALGRRVLAPLLRERLLAPLLKERLLTPLVRERLGELPSAFFDGRGRTEAWRSVQRSLHASDGSPVEQQEILVGARSAFGVFLRAFRQRAAAQRPSCG